MSVMGLNVFPNSGSVMGNETAMMALTKQIVVRTLLLSHNSFKYLSMQSYDLACTVNLEKFGKVKINNLEIIRI